jgi:hypothetical protein
MPQLNGIIFIKLDGGLVQSLPGAKLNLGGYERTLITGHSVYGYTQKLVPSSGTFELAAGAGTDLLGMQNKVNATLEFQADAGDTYIVRNAVCTKPTELADGEGKSPYEFQGPPAEKI